MAETKSFNELLLEKLQTEFLAIKITANKYYIDINSFYPYFVDPVDDKIQASEYPLSYAIIGEDESPSEISGSKLPVNNIISLTTGIIINVSKANSETEKENVKKTMKNYWLTENTISQIAGIDARYISKTFPTIKCYTHGLETDKLLIEFKNQIKTNLI